MAAEGSALHDTQTSTSTFQQQQKRALFIGNNKYDRWGTFAGNAPYNDIRKMAHCIKNLPTFEGVKDRDIVMETDLTYDGMKQKMEKISEGLRSGDILVFYYSGHGNRRRSNDEEEIKEEESTLVPTDAPRGYKKDDKRPNNEISDGMLLGWAKSVLDEGVKLLMIIDSCFAGGMGARDSGARKEYSFDPRKKSEQCRPRCWPWPEASKTEDCFKTRFGMIMAGKEFESPSLRKPKKIDGKCYSRLTFHFSGILSKASLAAEKMSLFQVSDELVKSYHKVRNENPSIYSGDMSDIFFNEMCGKVPPHPYHLVYLLQDEGNLILQFRSISIFSYVTEESVFELYTIEDIGMEDPYMKVNITKVREIRKLANGDNVCAFVLADVNVESGDRASSSRCNVLMERIKKYIRGDTKNVMMRAVKIEQDGDDRKIDKCQHHAEKIREMKPDENMKSSLELKLEPYYPTLNELRTGTTSEGKPCYLHPADKAIKYKLNVSFSSPDEREHKNQVLLCLVEISEDNSVIFHDAILHYPPSRLPKRQWFYHPLEDQGKTFQYKVFLFEIIAEENKEDKILDMVSAGELVDVFEKDVTLMNPLVKVDNTDISNSSQGEASRATQKRKYPFVTKWSCDSILVKVDSFY